MSPGSVIKASVRICAGDVCVCVCSVVERCVYVCACVRGMSVHVVKPAARTRCEFVYRGEKALFVRERHEV